MSMFYALVALCLAGSALAQVPGFGACPRNVRVQKDFDMSRFHGRWYEHSRFFHNFEIAAKCNVIDYTHDENSEFKIVNSFVSRFTGKPKRIEANIFMVNAEEPAKMMIKMPESFFEGKMDYWVLGTDYENFAVVYSCASYDYTNMKYAWILTRERNPSAKTLTAARQVALANNVKLSRFWRVEQQGCPEKPEQKIPEIEKPEEEKPEHVIVEEEKPEHKEPEPEHPEPKEPEHEHPEPKEPEHEHPEPKEPEHEHPEPKEPEHEHPEPKEPEHEHPEPKEPEHEHPEPIEPEHPVPIDPRISEPIEPEHPEPIVPKNPEPIQPEHPEEIEA